MAEFDPSIIERYATYLYRRATALTRGSTAFGAVLGAAVGAVPLVHALHWPIPHQFAFATALAGALVGGLVGYVVGDGRAMNVRLEAQLVLHQLQLERNTAAIAEALRLQQQQTVEVEPPKPEPLPVLVAAPPVSAAVERPA